MTPANDNHKYSVTLFVHVLWHLICHPQGALHQDLRMAQVTLKHVGVM